MVRLVPAATPQAVQDKLGTAVLAVLGEPLVRKALRDIGGLPSPLGPAGAQGADHRRDLRGGKFVEEAD